MRILLADDHALFRDGLASLLGAWGHEVVGQAADGEAAVDLAVRLRPDLVLMDVAMPGGGGLEATRQIAAAAPGRGDRDAHGQRGRRRPVRGDQGRSPRLPAQEPGGGGAAGMLEAVARGEAAITPAIAARMLTELARRRTATGAGRPDRRDPDRLDGPRAGRAPPGRRRAPQQGDGRGARDLREHGQVPPPQHPRQAPRAEPCRDGRHAVREGLLPDA